MQHEMERKLIDSPQGDTEKVALSCMLRLRGEGKSVEEIATHLKVETGLDLPPAAVDRVLRRVAGPAATDRGADPAFFTGQMGGG